MRFVSLIIVAVLSGRAHADHVQDARRHFSNMDFELVLEDTDAVAGDANASNAIRVQSLFLRGSALVVLERNAEAAAAFGQLLVLEPTYRAAPDTPPRIRAAFEAARALRKVLLDEQLSTEHGDELRTVHLAITVPDAPRGGRPLVWRVHIEDPPHLIQRVVLGYRRGTDVEYTVVAAPSAATVELTIPAAVSASPSTYRLAWYVQALHDDGARVREVGNDERPRWLTVAAGTPPSPPGVTKRWWFWAGVATLAASAIAVPVLIERGRDVGPQQIVFPR